MAHRVTIARLLLATAVVAPALCVVAAATLYGTARFWPGTRYLLLYVAPLFVAAPLWLRTRLASFHRLPTAVMVADAIVLSLAFARFLVGELLPFSGHMLFLSYSLCTTSSRHYRLLALILLVETSVFKLWLWRDYSSWTVGLALGLSTALVVRACYRQMSAAHP